MSGIIMPFSYARSQEAEIQQLSFRLSVLCVYMKYAKGK